MAESLSKKRFGANLLILGVGEVLTRALTFVAFVHLARVLRPEVFGTVEVALAVLMIATLLVTMGFPTLGTREVAKRPEAAASLAGRVVSAQLFLAICTVVALAAIALALPLNNRLEKLLMGFGISLLAAPFLLTWLFQGQNRMVWVTVPQIVRQLVFAAVVLGAVHRPDQVLRLPVAEILAVGSAAVLCLCVYHASGHSLSLRLRAAADRRLLREALPIGGSQMIWVLRMYGPTLGLALLAGEATVGHFGAAHRIMMVAQAALGVYFINLFPTLSRAAEQTPARLARLVERSASLVTLPAVALALATSFGASTVIRWVFGADYLRPDSVHVLAVLIWVIPVLVWRRHVRSALIALNHQSKELACSVAGVVMLALLLPLLTIALGALGTAVAMLASELIAAVLTLLLLKREVPELSIVRFVVPVGWFRGTPPPSGDIAKGSDSMEARLAN